MTENDQPSGEVGMQSNSIVHEHEDLSHDFDEFSGTWLNKYVESLVQITTPPPSGDLITDSRINSTDDIQSYFTETKRRHPCFNFSLPIAFERAAPSSWLNPKFDSPELEEQYLKSIFPDMRTVYRFSLLYILFCTIAWCIYLLIGDIDPESRIELLWPSIILAIITIMALWFTNTNMYRAHYHLTSVLTAIVLCTLGLSFLSFTGTTISALGHFALCLEILLLIYTCIPMILWIRAVIAVSYSILFETLSYFVPDNIGVHGTNPTFYNLILILRILLQFSVHLMALHVHVMKTVRKRGTFMKIGQNLLVRRHLEMEKNMKENMVHCMMPPKVADMLLNERGIEQPQPVEESNFQMPGSLYDVKSLFRPFYMHRIHNVSILFADIVGFTAISSKKPAEQLVELLNKLYNRFDDLCTFSGCEKVATLGDCYYCVSGCLDPRPDHAHCCVELGLEMVYAMQYFVAQGHEAIKMRVGIHTGTVFCGIVGTRRVKFDVWSNDVKMANLMESSGEPEQVHISEATRNYLGDDFLLEEGKEVMDKRTYFVTGRKKQLSQNNSLIETSIRFIHTPPLYNKYGTLSTNPSNVIGVPQVTPSIQEIPNTLNPSAKLSHHHQRFLPLKIITRISTSYSLLDSSDSHQADECLSNTGTTPTSITKRVKNIGLLSIFRKIKDIRKTDQSMDNQPPPDETAITVEQNESNQQIPLLIEPTNCTCMLNIPQQQGHTSRAAMIETQDANYSSYITDNRLKPERRPRVSIFTPAKHDIIATPQNTPRLSFESVNQFHSDMLSYENYLQNQIHAHNQTNAILHGGYNNSSLVNFNLRKAQINISMPGIPTRPVAYPLAEFLQYLQSQADVELLRCFQDNNESQDINLLRPPLKRFTLFFQSEQMEKVFRSNAHRFGTENENEGPLTLARPRYNTCLDILVSIVVYFCVAASLILISPNTAAYSNYWLVIFSIFTSAQLFALMYCTHQLCRRKISTHQTSERIFAAIFNWYPWHICLALLLTMPVVLIIIHYALLDLNQLQAFEYHYGILIFVSIVHFCNFTQLNFWMRNILALLGTIGFIIMTYIHVKDHKNQNSLTNGTIVIVTQSEKIIFDEVNWFSQYFYEIYIDGLLLLIFVWLLNRELEIGYRITFYRNEIAKQDKVRVHDMKNQVELLLHNIMPTHVAEHLKNYGKYSANHRNVAIIFASIVNFDDIYQESYLGGQEYLRVLNELIGDIDEQLSRPEFQCIEKIKTMGSTYMAASGLDSLHRCVRYHHIYALFEFSKSMQLVVSSFNKKLFEFEFILKIGFNVGDATSGVIGSLTLQYDIWGDTVNVASRMCSRGVKGRIQVGKNCLPYLEDRYEFERRGEIYMKGKGNLEVFLYMRDKPHSVGNDCGNECGLNYGVGFSKI